MSKKRLILLVIMLCFSTGTQAVCICEDTIGVRPALEEATSVFAGQVEKIIWLNPFDYLAKIRVYSSWKSAQEEYMWLASTKFNKECGFNFITGHEYLVYAYSVTQNLLSTSKCGRTKDWQKVTEQEVQLLDTLAHQYNNEAN